MKRVICRALFNGVMVCNDIVYCCWNPKDNSNSAVYLLTSNQYLRQYSIVGTKQTCIVCVSIRLQGLL